MIAAAVIGTAMILFAGVERYSARVAQKAGLSTLMQEISTAPPLLTPASTAESTLMPTPELTLTPTLEPTAMPPLELAELEDQLNGYFQKAALPGHWAVYVLNLSSGDWAEYTGEVKPTTAASLIKLFIAGAVLQADRDGTLTLSDSDMSDLAVMIRDSDNPSANRLVEKLGGGDAELGMRKVNDWAAENGCADTRMVRELGISNPTTENLTTVSDCAKVLSLIAGDSFVNAQSSAYMRDWMGAASANVNKTADIRTGIRGEGITIYNKIGELSTPVTVENDTAIVETPNSRFVLCVMSETAPSKQARSVIAGVARLILGWFDKSLVNNIASPAVNAAFTVAIDPGHQAKADYTTEPIGLGATEQKAKVSSGTQGAVTKVPEYELNLAVSLKLRDELEVRGYNVVMIRETNNVNISNSERAKIAADAGADILVRVHANGATDRAANGISTLCPTKNNSYIPQLYTQSRALSDDILTAMVAATGAKNRGVSEVDNMTGINWSTIPVTIVEMGFMTNPTEDQLMETDAYQQKLVTGLADGIDCYFDDIHIN